ncbi:ribonuclease H-like domain-containing protein [Tanacetum coccineum]
MSNGNMVNTIAIDHQNAFVQHLSQPAQQLYQPGQFARQSSLLGQPGQTSGQPSGQETILPQVFTTGTLHDPTTGAWNMDTSANSHLNNSVTSLSENFNTCMYPSISVGDGHPIPATNTGHSILSTPLKSLHLNNVLITPHIVKNLIFVRQFVRDNNCTIEFDEFGFSVKDFMILWVLLRCDSTGDLYPVTTPSPIPHVFLVSQHTCHQRLRHPRREVLRHLVSNNFISCNKEKPHVLCHACQLGKHVRLPFVSSNTVVTSCFDIIHSDVWTSPISSLSGFKYYFVLFRTYVRTQFKCEIRSFQCDHGGEFDNRNLHKLFANNGIQFRFSCPKTSQQNGKSERMYLAYDTLSRYKARIVANGSTQLEGVDVDETFSPVVKPDTIRTVLIYMHQPPGFQDSVHPDYVCLLQRSLYGLKQAPELGFSGLYLILLELAFFTVAIIRSLHQEFAMIDLGPLNYFLGISVSCDSSGLFLSQKKYIVEILDRAHMVNCNSSRTPVDTESKLEVMVIRYSPPLLQIWLLIYMLIGLVVQLLGGRFQVIMFFLATICSLGPSKRQPTLSHSSAEAEYRGVANAVAETCWLRNLLRELHTSLTFATLVYCDNVSAVYLSCNPVQHQRTKHIEINIHFVRDLVVAGQVRMLHVPSRYQFTDIFTKGLPSALSVRCPPAPTAGEC